MDATGGLEAWTRGPRLLLLLAGFALLIRLPFFFPAVIDWDESTFMLMGQDLLDGHLPYTHLWDNKPPLLFGAFAMMIAAFDSIPGIRACGWLLVAGTGYLIFRLASGISGRSAGLAAALIGMFFMTVTGGQAVMSELLAAPPMMGGLLLLSRSGGAGRYFAAGLCFMLAALFRTNLAIVVVALCVYAFVTTQPWRYRDRFIWFAALVAGMILPLALLTIPYLATGQADLLIRSVVLAPLSDTGERPGIGATLLSFLRGGISGQSGLWFLAAIGAALAIRGWKRGPDAGVAGYVGVMAVASTLSVLATRAAHGHYLIQVVPPLAVFAGIAWQETARRSFRLVFLLLILVTSVMPLGDIAREYGNLIARAANGERLASGRAYRIAALLEAENARDKRVYLMTDHIVYWMLGTEPLAPIATHPSNIAKEGLLIFVEGRGATTETVLATLLATRPDYIVKEAETTWLEDKPAAASLLAGRLAEDYERIAIVGKAEVFRLVDASG
ncbi:ArnT family glycosyltransferase [Oricola sp.]|uniref:ArnT family glycosyltransferase n=1 Tax=Oricola sp. TaxID=1979950 RepID=UPI0035164863